MREAATKPQERGKAMFWLLLKLRVLSWIFRNAERHVFVSYGGLIHMLKKGSVGLRELSTGLFYFDSKRSDVIDENNFDIELLRSYSKEEADRIYQIILASVNFAGSRGAIVWRPQGTQPNYITLSNLLEQFGYSPLELDPGDFSQSTYNVDTAKRLLNQVPGVCGRYNQ